MNRTFLNNLLCMIAVMLVFSSCDKNEEYPTSYSTLGDIENANGNEYFVNSDKGNKLLISNYSSLKQLGIEEGDRIFAEFFMNATPNEAYDEVIDVYYVYKVLVKDPVALTTENSEEVADDKIDTYNMTCTDKYLNIWYTFFTGGSEAHILNLVTVDEPKKDEEGYIYVEFRHNSKNDPSLHPYNGIVSFKLDKLKADYPDAKGLIVRVRTFDNGERFSKIDFDGESEVQEVAASNAKLSEVFDLAE